MIWGASGHAKVVTEIIRLQGEFQIVGYLDNINPDRWHSTFCGAQILGGEEQLENLKKDGIENIIIAFGDCKARLEIGNVVKQKGFRLATAIHPNSIISPSISIKPGTVITAGAIINPGSVIGESVILNTASSVDHDCVIGDGAHICPGVHLAGNVSVGMGTWIGIGTSIIEKISIGSSSFIGAGSVVVDNVPDGVLAFGNPAKVIREK